MHPKKSKWEGEDEEDDGPAVRFTQLTSLSRPSKLMFITQTDWDESSEEEDDDKPAPAPVAPPKKKGTLKQKLAEKEAEKARRRAAGEDDDVYDSDEVLDPREKARRDKERQLQSDMNNAAELFGAAALGGTSRAFVSLSCH